MSLLRHRRNADAKNLARAQGLFNIVGGAWPIFSLGTFEWVYGEKKDIFLQKAVGGLLMSVGYAQLTAEGSKDALDVARRVGITTALSLLVVDLVYIPKGEMRKTYVQDALMEIGWIAAWLRVGK